MKKLIYLSLITILLSCGMEKLDKDEQEKYTTFEIVKNAQQFDTVTYKVVKVGYVYYIINDQTNLVEYKADYKPKDFVNMLVLCFLVAFLIFILIIIIIKP